MNCEKCNGNMTRILTDEQLFIWECSACYNTIILDSYEEELEYDGI